MKNIKWTVTDSIVVRWINVCYVLSVLSPVLPLVLGDPTWYIYLLFSALFLVQAWLYRDFRTVEATCDFEGFTKKVDKTSWTVKWENVAEVQLRKSWGAWHLVITTSSRRRPGNLNLSDTLGYQLWGVRSAIQLDPAVRQDVEKALRRKQVPLTYWKKQKPADLVVE